MPIVSIVMAVAVIIVLVQNIRVTGRNRSLRHSLDTLARVQVAEGDLVPYVRGVDLEGRRVSLSLRAQDHATLLLSLSVHSQYCRNSLKIWQRVAKAWAPRIETVVVTKDPLPDVLDFIASGAEFPARPITDPTFETYIFLRMATVPSTVLVGPDGVVLRAWIGETNDAREVELVGFLDALSHGQP